MPWILFRDDHIWKHPRDRSTLRFWIPKLQRRFPQIRFLSDSQSIGDFLSSCLEVPFHVLPLPHAPPYQPISRPQHPTRRLLFLGEPRQEKGTVSIQHLCRTAKKDTPFELLCAEGLSLPSSLLPVSRHPVPLAPDQYWHTLRSADCILLPYSPERYQRRTSGIFVESIFLGKVPLVRDHTWMAEELKRFDLGELIIDWESPSLLDHCTSLLASNHLYDKLCMMQNAYQAFHSLDSFQSCIKSMLQK